MVTQSNVRWRHALRALTLLLALTALFSLAACGGDAATPSPVPVASTAVPVSPQQAVFDHYQELINNQRWSEAATLFADSVDSATRVKFVADLTQFAADNGAPTQVLVENVTQNGDNYEATVTIRTVNTQMKQKVTLVQQNGEWKIGSVETL